MEPLIDPLNDRVVKDVQPPPHHPLSHSLLFPRRTFHSVRKPDWRALRSHLHNEGRLAKADVLELIDLASSLFRTPHTGKERNLIELRDPVTVVGDIHGQYFDLVKMLEIADNPDQAKFLFLGDYVDRGSFSLEVILLLYAMKINYPSTIFMLRGNHECRQMTSFFNFRAECLDKVDLEVYDRVMESFDCLPIACLVNGKFLALHGGISPDLRSLEDFNAIRRFQEPPKQGLFCDLLWADPVEQEEGVSEEQFKPNEVRGCSYFFNVQAANSFLRRNGLLSIIRAHEAQLDGYKMHRWNGGDEFPVVITLFSAPNYCDVYNNKAAIIQLENNTLNIKQYNYSAHPYILPNFMDIFSWSLPFVQEKILEMLANILKPSESEAKMEAETGHVRELHSEMKKTKAETMRNKVKAISSMMKMYKTLREEKELILQLRGLCPDNKIPRGLLMEGKEAIANMLEDFRRAKKWDAVNEKRPDQ